MTKACSNVAKSAVFPQRRPLAQAVALVFALGGSAQAAVINVNSAADPINNDGNCTLREAIQAANTDLAVDTCAAGGGADMITFNPGLGQITLTSGQIDITEELIIQGPAAGQVIDGNANGRIFAVTVANTPLTLRNLTLQNGRTTAAGAIPNTCAADTGEGGAVCTLGNLTLVNSTVSNSSTTGIVADGGGIFASNATLLTNSTVSGNSTTGTNAEGGGIYVDGAATLTNSTVSGNSTEGDNADGGGIYVDGNATLTDSTVSGNSAAGYGGGVSVEDGDLTLENSTVSGNTTTDDFSDGGGISVEDGDLTLENSTVSGNSAGRHGGGISVELGDATLTNSTVSGNTAGENGGGLDVDDEATLTNSTVSGNTATSGFGDGGGIFASNATLTNSTVSGNSAGRHGGGLYAIDATLTNSTVSGNSAADEGGGIYADGNATLTSTILANNTVNGIASDCEGTNATGNNNLVEATGDFACNLAGVNNIFGMDPLLAPLADNGCAVEAGVPESAACVQTHALIVGSPALDTGDANGQTTDERGVGFPRELDGDGDGSAVADIGAYEGFIIPPPIPALGGWGLLTLISGLLGLLGWRSRPRRPR